MMLGTHNNATLVLLSVGLNQPTLRNILDAVGAIRLNDGDRLTLKSLLDRWERASGKRNKIVHGHWMLSIEMVPGPSGKRDHTKSTWIRFYSPPDPTVYDKIFSKKDQKLLSRYRFRLSDITQATADVRKIAQDMRAFNASAKMKEFVTPQPISLEQEEVKK
jgi:hypothetical protein